MAEPMPLTDDDRADLVAYLDGELDEEGEQLVEARLGRDPIARAEADTLRRTWEMLDTLPHSEPSQDFTERTLTRISAIKRQSASDAATVQLATRLPNAFGFSVWAAAAVVAVALGYWLVPTAPQKPIIPPTLDNDLVFVREPRIIECLPLYLAVDNIQYLLALDKRELFDDEPQESYGYGDGTRQARGRIAEREHREKLQKYLDAFHALSPEMQARIRMLDRDLHDKERVEDAATRARLYGVMERYVGWLSRLADDDRLRVEAAAPGDERLGVVRELLEQQWLDNLPVTIADKPDRFEKWRKDESERQAVRLRSLRTAEEATLLLPAVQQQLFRDSVKKFVLDTLEPKLNPSEKRRLESAIARSPSFTYFHTVLVLSEAHSLTPPGPTEQWTRFREPRPRVVKLPD